MSWIPLLALGLLGLAFLVVPLWRAGAVGAQANARQTRSQMAGQLYQQRLAELDVELAQGVLNQADYQEAVRELKLALLADQQGVLEKGAVETGAVETGAVDTGVVDPATRRTPLAFVLAAVFCVGAVGLYHGLGEPNADALRATGAVLRQAEIAPAELSAWQSTLEQRLAGNPDDTQSWYLLGHVHLKAERYGAAADAFGQAHTSMPPGSQGTDVNLDLYWLQARYLAARGQLDDTSKEIVQRVLAKAPNHPFILEILAMEAFRTEDYREAIGVLNRALSGNLGVAQRASLQVGLNQARQRLAAKETAAAGASSPGVEVTLAGLGQAPKNGTFICDCPAGWRWYALCGSAAARPGLSHQGAAG